MVVSATSFAATVLLVLEHVEGEFRSWVSPVATGHVTPAGGWSNEEAAYDGNPATGAVVTANDKDLILVRDEVDAKYINQIGIRATENSEPPTDISLEVDVYNSTSESVVGTYGPFTVITGEEHLLDTERVLCGAVGIRATNLSSGSGTLLEVRLRECW